VEITVLAGVAPSGAKTWTASHRGSSTILRFPGVGEFVVRGGATITVRPERGVDTQLLRLYLLRAGLATILVQRGIFAIHAAAVQDGRRCVALSGPPGAGKSTLAAALCAIGFTPVEDDLAVLHPDHGELYLRPGISCLKLSAEVIVALGGDPGEYPALGSGSGGRWYGRAPVAPIAGPVRDLFVMEPGTDLAIETLRGNQATVALLGATYGAEMLPGASRRAHFAQTAEVAARLRVHRLTMARDLRQIRKAAEAMVAELERLDVRNH
jgi:hypothetical protein